MGGSSWTWTSQLIKSNKDSPESTQILSSEGTLGNHALVKIPIDRSPQGKATDADCSFHQPLARNNAQRHQLQQPQQQQRI
jgi:hypothetical protein